jgi:ketosteroid isomerase-like protein
MRHAVSADVCNHGALGVSSARQEEMEMLGTVIAKAKVTASYAHLNNRDTKSFLAAWHEDATWLYPGTVSASGEFRGKAAIEEWFAKFLDQFPQLKVTPRSVCLESVFDLVGSNVVAVYWDEESTNKDGVHSRFSGVTLITLRFGKATRAQDFIFATDEELRKAWGE